MSNEEEQSQGVIMNKAVFWAVVSVNLVVAVDVLSLMLMLPIIATFSQHLGASKAMTGTLFTVYSTSALVSSFFMGRISDYFGRRYIFLMSAFGTFCSSVGTIFVSNFTQLLITVAISGMFTGTIGTAYAYVADVIKEEKKRTIYLSYVTATLSCCMVLGPLVGGLISTWQLRGPFYISAILACIETLLVYGYLKNPGDLLSETEYSLLPPHTAGTDPDDEHAHTYTHAPSYNPSKPALQASPSTEYTSNPVNPPADIEHTSVYVATDVSHSGAEMETLLIAAEPTPIPPSPSQSASAMYSSAWFDYRAVLVGGVGVLFNTITYLGLVSLLPLILQRSSFHIVDSNEDNTDNNDDLSDSEIRHINFYMGTYLSVYGFAQVVCILCVFPILNKHMPPLYICALGCGIYGGTFLFVPLIASASAFYAIFFCMAIGNSFSRPIFPTYLTTLSPPHMKAEYMSIISTSSNLAIVLGGQLTMFYAYSALDAILFTGGVSLVNAVMLGGYGMYVYGHGKKT
ncbi:MFS transporter [archaeon]|nr:MAG: MFS transporter [archaeon]